MAHVKKMFDCKVASIVEELASTLQHLLQKMKELRINFGFTNLSHNRQYEGTPVPYILSSVELTEAKVEKGKVVIRSKDAVFRIYESKRANSVMTLLEWARYQLAQLKEGLTATTRIISAPSSITFFSTSTRPPRKATPIFSGT